MRGLEHLSSVMSPLVTPNAQLHSFIVTLTQTGLVKLCVTHTTSKGKTQNKSLETIRVGRRCVCMCVCYV